MSGNTGRGRPKKGAPTEQQLRFGKWVTFIRDARRLNDADLARRMSEAGAPIARASFWRVRLGKREFTINEFISFCSVTDVDPAAWVKSDFSLPDLARLEAEHKAQKDALIAGRPVPDPRVAAALEVDGYGGTAR